MSKKVISTIAGLGLYFVVTGISYAAFSQTTGGNNITLSPLAKVSPKEQVKNKVDPTLPKNEICPINGVKYTTLEKEDWEKRRPMAVMIENSAEARPHSGISRADVIYEALAEGWITRFMALFYCNTPFENITVAPVRSARTYFIDWVSEYDALYVHVGGANRVGENAQITDPRADALGQIDKYGIKDMDQFGIGYPDCYRNPDRLDHPVATEHTMVCFTDNLYKIAAKREWTNVDSRGIPWNKNFKEWSFKEDAVDQDRGTVASIKIVFAQGYDKYDVLWEYDKTSNSYKRSNGGVTHLDLETNQQLAARNVAVILTKLTGPVDDLGHFLYTTIGKGKALIFQDGKSVVGTWEKKSRIGRTVFYGPSGKEIEFNRGLIWIEVIPGEDQITY
ncbi:hypothetical protein A2Y99_04930 [Candidatus Gottesmanbacteria bacterium RBG_13_37_7]|uniref:Lipoprotein YerB n=1 Tax=Candidatus Gottesmanbacteria bacterium RBG_13_37_7 TaxID=1798369 RepID=A0A1F5YHA4_9BACT|nr:MAG: hypothetical protein A2Y99_04930 [Candidatus Gottesmanbacteria bacterium RBG_13_37_7]